MSNNDSQGCGCLVIFAIVAVVSVFKSCSDKHSSAPVVSQPATGYVAASSNTPPSSTPTIPTVSEPYGALQSGGLSNADAGLIIKNSLYKPAYVKVVNNFGQTCATLYLRAGESYELGINPGNYKIKYVSGPANQWRGTTHYFGSYSEFNSGDSDYIGYNQQLTITIYQTVSKYGSGSNVKKISEDDFWLVIL